MSEKLCVFCEHWAFDGGSPGYSEATPGSDASMACLKAHWHPRTASGRRTSLRFKIWDLNSPEEFRAKIKTAEQCPDYSPCTREESK